MKIVTIAHVGPGRRRPLIEFEIDVQLERSRGVLGMGRYSLLDPRDGADLGWVYRTGDGWDGYLSAEAYTEAGTAYALAPTDPRHRAASCKGEKIVDGEKTRRAALEDLVAELVSRNASRALTLARVPLADALDLGAADVVTRTVAPEDDAS